MITASESGFGSISANAVWLSPKMTMTQEVLAMFVR